MTKNSSPRIADAIELCYKHIHDPDILKADILFEALGELDRAGFKSVVMRSIGYIVRAGDTLDTDALFEKLIPNLTEVTREKVMTIEQRLVQRGELRGEQRGIEIGEQRGIEIGEQRGRMEGRLSATREMAVKLWKEGLGKEKIARLTGLNLKYLEDLLKNSDRVH